MSNGAAMNRTLKTQKQKNKNKEREQEEKNASK